MSVGTIKLLIAGALLLHGLGHAGVFVALIANPTYLYTLTPASLLTRSYTIDQ